MNLKYIDAHGQLQFAAYDNDREDVILRAKENGVGMITVGTDLKMSELAVELAVKNESMWATVGMHPIYVGEHHEDELETGESEAKRPKQIFDKEKFLELAKHPKVVAIGECGLDYFHSTPDDMEEQRRIFLEQIEIANEVGKPLMLHVRNPKEGGHSAYAEALEMILKYAKVKADFHFFAGSLVDLHKILDAGHYVSFAGPITFAKQYEELIKAAPLGQVMVETDCPYAAPVPHRGKRNEPVYVIEMAKKVAAVRGEDEAEVAEKLLRSTKAFFGLNG